jgi:hypothetical protein
LRDEWLSVFGKPESSPRIFTDSQELECMAGNC